MFIINVIRIIIIQKKRGGIWKIWQWGKNLVWYTNFIYLCCLLMLRKTDSFLFLSLREVLCSCVVDQIFFFFLTGESNERTNTLAWPRTLLKVRENSCRASMLVLAYSGLCSDYTCSMRKFQCRRHSAMAEGDRKALGGSSGQGTFPTCWFKMQMCS